MGSFVKINSVSRKIGMKKISQYNLMNKGNELLSIVVTSIKTATS